MKKKKLLSRVVSTLRKGSIQFSPSWPPVSYSFPLRKKQRSRSKKDKGKPPLLIPEVIPPDQTFPLARSQSRSTSLNPIQRESLPMIGQKIEQAKAMGRNDLVLLWAAIEYSVRHPRKAQKAVDEILDFLDRL